MNYLSIWAFILSAWLTLIRRMDANDDDVSEDLVYSFGRDSSYAERRWNITSGSDLIKDNHIEDCLMKVAPKHSTWRAEGPLCEICSRAIKQIFQPDEPIKLRYAAFSHGILAFPETKDDEVLIDFVLCSYDPSVGIDRFYLTRGKEENSAYTIKTVGSKDNKFIFNLDEHYISLSVDRTTSR